MRTLATVFSAVFPLIINSAVDVDSIEELIEDPDADAFVFDTFNCVPVGTRIVELIELASHAELAPVPAG